MGSARRGRHLGLGENHRHARGALGAQHAVHSGQFDLAPAHLARMLLAVKEDEAPDPMRTGVLGAQAVMPDPQALPGLVGQHWRWHDSLPRQVPLPYEHSVPWRG